MATTEVHLFLIDLVVMLAIVMPTIIMTIFVLRRYRAGNQARYEPNWSRSLGFEVAMWGVPVVAVGILAYFLVAGGKASDPHSPTVVHTDQGNALHIQVVSLDWRWLFIYPNQHIATLGTLTVPAHRAVRFNLTASAASNSFFIPRLAGQIYVMPGRRSQLVLSADKIGDYRGFSALQSGAGFSWMKFTVHAVDGQAFGRWVDKVQGSPKQLTQAKFEKLAQPTIAEGHKPSVYGQVASNLFHHVIVEVQHGKVYRTPLFAGKKMDKDKPLKGAAAG